MTPNRRDRDEEPVLLLTPDDATQPPVSDTSLNVAKERIDPQASQRAVAEQERIINEKILRNKAIKELDTGGFGGGFSRRDKGWLLLGFAFFYIVCLLFGVQPSIKTAIAGGILSAFFLFLAVFFIEEFTKFKFPRIRIPIVDDLIFYAFDLIWNHRIIAGGIVFFLLLASTFFVGVDAWDSPYDTDRETLEDQCKDEQWASCARLAHFHQMGIAAVKNGLPETGKAPDTVKAFTLYRKACDGGNGTGCLGLWLLWGRKETFALDKEEALGLLKKGCELKEDLACQVRSAYDQGLDIEGRPEALAAITDDMSAVLGVFRPSQFEEDGEEEF